MTTDALFRRINEVSPALQGWCEIDKAYALAGAVLALRPRICVEIGVFAGKSLIPVALAMRAIGTGVVYAIDPWTNAAAVEGYDGENAKWWSGIDLERIYNEFLSQVSSLDLGAHVVVQRAKSDDVEPPDAIDILHCDGQHTDQAARDVRRFASRIHLGGLCFMDDIAWTNGSGTTVQTAVDELFKLGFSQLYQIGTGAVFQRVDLPNSRVMGHGSTETPASLHSRRR